MTLFEASQLDDLKAIERHTKMEFAEWTEPGKAQTTNAVSAETTSSEIEDTPPSKSAQTSADRKPRARRARAAKPETTEEGASEAHDDPKISTAPLDEEPAAVGQKTDGDANDSATTSLAEQTVPAQAPAKPKPARRPRKPAKKDEPAADPIADLAADATQEDQPETEQVQAEAASEKPEAEARQIKRPRHTKPTAESFAEKTTTLLCNAGSHDGVLAKDIVRLLATSSKLTNEHIHEVRVHERFSIVRVPSAQAEAIASKADGSSVQGRALRVGIASRK